MKHNQNGGVNGLAISLIFVILLLIGAAGFGIWAFSGRQDYKNNSDAKVGQAVTVAKQQQTKADQAIFAQEAKQPLQAYQGPEAYGSLIVNYPKTWSAYVDASGQGGVLVNGYFAPGVVPSVNNPNSVFALQVQVLGQAYNQVVQTFNGQQQAGKLAISAYALPKLPKVVGIEVTGQIVQQGPTTTMVVLPLRSETLEISTQGTQYLGDFNNNILPNFSFSP